MFKKHSLSANFLLGVGEFYLASTESPSCSFSCSMRPFGGFYLFICCFKTSLVHQWGAGPALSSARAGLCFDSLWFGQDVQNFGCCFVWGSCSIINSLGFVLRTMCLHGHC